MLPTLLAFAFLVAAPGAWAQVTPELTAVQILRNGSFGNDTLEGTSALAVTPDGALLFATGAVHGSLVVLGFEAGPSPAFALLDVVRDGEGGVDGTAGARDVALSPDGFHLYVAGSDDDAVGVFAFDGGSATLAFVEQQRDGVAGVTGLAGAGSVAVSPDGGNVYASGAAAGAVATFARDAGTGALVFLESEPVGAGAGTVLVTASRVHVAHDAGIAVFARDPSTGALTLVADSDAPLEGADGGSLPILSQRVETIAPSPDGSHLYAVVEVLADGQGGGCLTCPPIVETRSVTAMALDAGTGVPSFIARSWLRFDTYTQEGIADLAVTPDGTRLLAAATRPGAVLGLDRDPVSGIASNPTLVFVGPAVRGVSALAFGASSDRVFTAAADESAVAALAGGAPMGGFTLEATIGEGGVTGLRDAVSALVSPDGRDLHVVGARYETEANQLRRSADGTLDFVSYAVPLPTSSEWVAAPDGRFVHGSSGATGLIADLESWSRDPATGSLSHVQSLDVPGGVRSLLPAPDGRFLYAATFGNTLAVVARAAEGELSVTETYQGLAEGMVSFPAALATSPTGHLLYVGGDGGLGAYARDAVTGLLTPVELRTDLDVIVSLAMDPAGRHLYALRRSFADSRITILERADDGTVAFRGRVLEVGEGARTLAMDPSGRWLLVTGSQPLAIYARDGASGLLSEVPTPAEANGAASYAAISPNGHTWYLGQPAEGSLVAFSVPEPAAAAASLVALLALAAARARRGLVTS